jgi:hypothetical protein
MNLSARENNLENENIFYFPVIFFRLLVYPGSRLCRDARWKDLRLSSLKYIAYNNYGTYFCNVPYTLAGSRGKMELEFDVC